MEGCLHGLIFADARGKGSDVSNFWNYQGQISIDYIIRIINSNFLIALHHTNKKNSFFWTVKIVSWGYLVMGEVGGGAFCWNADGCRWEVGRGQKSWKYANILKRWSLMTPNWLQFFRIIQSGFFSAFEFLENVWQKRSECCVSQSKWWTILWNCYITLLHTLLLYWTYFFRVRP